MAPQIWDQWWQYDENDPRKVTNVPMFFQWDGPSVGVCPHSFITWQNAVNDNFAILSLWLVLIKRYVTDWIWIFFKLLCKLCKSMHDFSCIVGFTIATATPTVLYTTTMEYNPMDYNPYISKGKKKRSVSALLLKSITFYLFDLYVWLLKDSKVPWNFH